jgi:3-oxoacyl-[acyl-carrier-protein] synthase II
MGAAGAFEGVATVLSVYHQCAPATANYRDPDPEIELDIVAGGARRWRSATRCRTTSALAATTGR